MTKDHLGLDWNLPLALGISVWIFQGKKSFVIGFLHYHPCAQCTNNTKIKGKTNPNSRTPPIPRKRVPVGLALRKSHQTDIFIFQEHI